MKKLASYLSLFLFIPLLVKAQGKVLGNTTKILSFKLIKDQIKQDPYGDKTYSINFSLTNISKSKIVKIETRNYLPLVENINRYDPIKLTDALNPKKTDTFSIDRGMNYDLNDLNPRIGYRFYVYYPDGNYSVEDFTIDFYNTIKEFKKSQR